MSATAMSSTGLIAQAWVTVLVGAGEVPGWHRML
jgi:hypothetical protein